MEKHLQLSLPVETFVKAEVALCNHSNQPAMKKRAFTLFQLLCETGFDFYRVLELYSKLENLSQDEVRLIMQMSPPSRATLHPIPKDIRLAMPRWTATKYHSGPIDEVIAEIQAIISTRKDGVYMYNSNLNPTNRRSLNDLYIMFVAGDVVRWYDINRRSNYLFLSE